ncbi:MAG TPA: S9 family peptidase [Steroidobacteraceae bacterium]
MLLRRALRGISYLLLAVLSTAAVAEKLTIERIFAAPELSGASLRSPQISPDGKLVAYLRGAQGNKDRLDLWAYDVARGEHRLLVDSAGLVPIEQAPSAQEQQRRERQRTSSLSGIIEYQFSPDSHYLLIPLDGDLYLYDLHAAPAQAVRRLTSSHSETDARFSPRGHYVSFIRKQNLIILDLASGTEHALTREGGGLVSFGTAEFIAQEEMGRGSGYWWAPDEKRIAYTRVDESPVGQLERFEIYANTTKVVQQRYPAAGTPNAIVQLFVSCVPTPAPAAVPACPQPVQVDLGASTDYYLARVNWFPDASALAVQREARDQKTLTLLRADPSSGATRELLSERSETWIDLNDDLTFLRKVPRFIWASSRTGFLHLYLYDWSGKLLRPLTSGPWRVTPDIDGHGVRGVDESLGLVYFTANAQTPLERHLYSASLRNASMPLKRITTQSGWHAISMSKDARMFLDTFSTPDDPPSMTLRSANGTALAPLVPNTVSGDHPYAPYRADHLPTQFGTLSASDGQTLYYQLIKPRNLLPGHRYPVIVDVYGGPGVQRVRRAWGGFPQSNEGFFRQYLAQQGYIVFTLDNRGSGFRDVAFETALYHHLGSVEVQDQVAGVQFLKTLAYVDPARIGVFGWSYGGYLALMCMLQTPGIFAAGVAGAPPTDWRLYDTHYTERYMGTPADNPQGYERSSVMTYAGQLRGALLIVHGMADDNVLFTNSTTLFRKLQELDKPFDIMTYPGAKHGLLRHADTGPHAYMTIQRFFDRTIGDHGASAEMAAGHFRQ